MKRIDWDEIRLRYEAGVEPVGTLCAVAGISESGLRYRARKEGWRRRRRRGSETRLDIQAMAEVEAVPDRASLVERLSRVLNKQIADVEERIAALGDGSADGEREARTLSVLARTLEKLIEIDEAAEKSGDKEKVSERERDSFRAELTRRLARLGRQSGV